VSARPSRLRRKGRPTFSGGEPPVPGSDTAVPLTESKRGREGYRQRLRECPSCGRGVALNSNGRYRRHFATAPDGTRRLCVASSQLATG
jgi:hypothetical protein